MFNNLLFSAERSAARQELSAAKLAVPPAPVALAPGTASAAIMTAHATAMQAHVAARTAMVPALARLAAVDQDRERARLLMGFAAAFMISAAGVRTIAELIVVTPPAHMTNYATMVDILLTAGLLAGGSNALAKFAEVIQEAAGQKLTALRTTP